MKVVIAMSGGVDSSVCAALMQEQGFDCVGMTMRLWKGPEAEAASCSDKSCCGAESVEDARLVCETLGIPFYAINFREEFWSEVVETFANEYAAGRTPSPCILCNERLKFDTLYEKAIDVGAERVCTGHYAQIRFDEASGRWQLLKGVDRNKDQSYFLFSMTQEQLSKTLFPLGKNTKPEIREMAHGADLVTAGKPESQDICFIPDGDYAGFLERHFPQFSGKEGVIKHVDGEVLGEHQGVHRFTVGQRKGLRVAFSEPLYVTRIDAATQEVTVGPRAATLQRSFVAERMNWIMLDPEVGSRHRADVRIRSRGPEAPATIEVLEGGSARITFDEPQSSVSPGQAAVAYRGDAVMAGGWICSHQEAKAP